MVCALGVRNRVRIRKGAAAATVALFLSPCREHTPMQSPTLHLQHANTPSGSPSAGEAVLRRGQSPSPLDQLETSSQAQCSPVEDEGSNGQVFAKFTNSTKKRPPQILQDASLASPSTGRPSEIGSPPPACGGEDPGSIQEEAWGWENPDWTPFEHRGWAPTRRRIYAAMARTDQSSQRKHDFCHCGERVHVFSHAVTGEVEFHSERCKDRWCLPCGQARSRRIAKSLGAMMAKQRNMFITLTVRGWREQTLVSQLERLKAAWRELRRLKGWSTRVDGGAVMTEVKWSETSGGHWHVHYHIVAQGRFVDESWLKAAWKLITGDSDQVRVLPVNEEGRVLSYVSKYASKPVDASFTGKPHLLDEAMRGLKGQRLCACFGSWHGTPLLEEVEEDETEFLTQWKYEGTTRDIQERALRGEAEAKRILEAVGRQQRLRHTLSERCRGPDENDSSTLAA